MNPYVRAKKLWVMTLILCMIGTIFTFSAEASGTANAYSQPPWKEATLSTQGPAARYASAMAYEEDTGNTVLFGGADINYRVMNDTWVWDGKKWTNVTPADSNDSPIPREYAAMAYAGPGKGMIMFGGENRDYYGETWVWDGAKWNNVTPADTSVNYPPPRIEFGMVYIGNGEVLLYGGFGPQGGRMTDTWIWNGTSWRDVTPVNPGDSPNVANRVSMAYDKKNDEVVLFGGYKDTAPYPSDGTWVWKNQKWSLKTPVTSPPRRVFASMAYDSNIEKVILVGGEAGYVPKDDVWLWDGVNWTKQTEANLPELSLSNMVYDTMHGQSVLFSGYNDDYLFETTWTHRISEVSNVKTTRASNAGNSVTDWTVEFVTSEFGDLTGNTDTITVQAPAGTVLSTNNGDYFINGSSAVSATQTAANNVTLQMPHNISAHSQVTLNMKNTTNPGAGSYPKEDFTVATSQDIVWASPATDDLEFLTPHHIQLAATPSSTTVGSVVTVTGVVYDGNAIPVAGVTVDLTATSGSIGYPSVTTDVYGHFSTSFTAPSTEGTVTITAVDNANPSVTGTVTVQVNRAVPVPDHIQLAATPTSTTVGGGVTVNGIVYDGNAIPVAGVAVNLAASSGSIGSPSVTTDVYGHFSTSFTAPSTSGTVTITATANANPSVTGTVSVQVTSPSSGGNNGGVDGGGAGAETPSSPLASSNGKLTVPHGKSGTVSLGNEVSVFIPADSSSKELQIAIDKPAKHAPIGDYNPVSAIFEISKNFPEDFAKPVTVTLAFDPAGLKAGQHPAVFYFDQGKKEWVEVGPGHVTGKQISVDVNHLGTFAVFGVQQTVDVPKPEINFSDIAKHWAEAGIKQALSLGIVEGYPDGSFKPDKAVTRAEFAVMLMKIIKPQEGGTALSFTDTTKIGKWAQEAVAKAVQAGIIEGFEDGSFRPDVNITRSEMAAMIARALKLTSEESLTGFADDGSIPAWAKGAVAAMKKQGFLQGKGSNNFFPADSATRAEAVTVLLKILERNPARKPVH